MTKTFITILLLVFSININSQVVTKVVFETVDSETSKVLETESYKISANLKYGLDPIIDGEGYVMTPKGDGSPITHTFKIFDIEREDEILYISAMVTNKGLLYPTVVIFAFTDNLILVVFSESDHFKKVNYRTAYFLQ